ncbi:jhy protein homolog isoform X2 [Pseudorasbora parva]|uniref:jhy protein homolog isoform X2 n=1 Tax=Pseudorasbora parva TaxID=51549 RepID=UPI00351EC703
MNVSSFDMHSRQTPPEDEYADLRYDPNWRKNQEGGQFLNQLNGRLSLPSSEDSFEPLENVALGSRRDYVVVSNPPTVQMEKDLSQSPSSPFHLHPHQEAILDSPESKSSCMSSEGTPWDDGEHLNVKSVSPQKTSSRQLSDPRPVRSKEDIVERNKATLGLNTHKQGSYLNALQQKDKPDQTKQPRKTSYETIATCSPESQDNVRDPELMWLQKTQKLKQSHKERKEPKRREKTSNHPDQPKPPVPESKPSAHLIKPLPERHVISADGLSQDSPVAYTHDPPQHQSRLPSYTQAPPTVNLNINLQTPANPAQPLNLSQKETIVTLVSKALQWDRLGLLNPPFLQPGYHHSVLPNSEGQMRLAPKAVVSSPAPHSGVVHAVDRSVPQRHAGKPLNNAFENSSFKNHNRLRIPMLKLPTSPQVEAGHYPPEVLPNDDESVGPFVPPTQISALYTVLPPIGRANGSDTELGSNRSEQLLNPIHRSSSEGYLSQMEKYRQLKAKTNYKAYTLKDYKDMRQEVKLGGLGPTNTIPEAVAEKIRRQKLYSNVIREQNKKISRIPSLSSKDPVGSDNKDTVPRRKALEYAKTIAKPKPPPKSKDRPREQPQYLQETDPIHLATLEMLRRHEDEKRAVACFKTIHAI